MFLAERQIEIRAELMMNAADRRYMRGELTEAEYQDICRDINAWCEAEWRTVRREQ